MNLLFLILMMDSGGKFITAECCTTFHSPILKTCPEFSKSDVDHCDILDTEKRWIVFLSMLLNFENNVQIDTESQEWSIDKKNVEESPKFLTDEQETWNFGVAKFGESECWHEEVDAGHNEDSPFQP
ncbi:hypothetical protein GCK72_014871 [Caenorhabditis remanei]|uniref:DUF19 domain-containing protein n=1 Tax=Caenorhabditis remanei TaxID=31234 RepID=A0A6A5GVC3_CAERE|nr:hypothetical protein GCK72_014871 [Caenorhabditis remanei]KAF1758413.1 hypothetical protein GCK72_014871 [Caenorhabditis remanei]